MCVETKILGTRFERLARLRKCASPAGWEWVDDILRQFPALGCLKAHERIQASARHTVTQSAQNSFRTMQGLKKRLDGGGPGSPEVRAVSGSAGSPTPPGRLSVI